jgi:hypothetical protein
MPIAAAQVSLRSLQASFRIPREWCPQSTLLWTVLSKEAFQANYERRNRKEARTTARHPLVETISMCSSFQTMVMTNNSLAQPSSFVKTCEQHSSASIGKFFRHTFADQQIESQGIRETAHPKRS